MSSRLWRTNLGLGLAGLQERVNSLGGHFSLKNAKGTDASVVMLLPMEFTKDAA